MFTHKKTEELCKIDSEIMTYADGNFVRVVSLGDESTNWFFMKVDNLIELTNEELFLINLIER